MVNINNSNMPLNFGKKYFHILYYPSTVGSIKQFNIIHK